MCAKHSIQASFERDDSGFWIAHIEQLCISDDSQDHKYPVTVRHTLPVPASATHEQAQEAFFDLLAREMRRYGSR